MTQENLNKGIKIKEQLRNIDVALELIEDYTYLKNGDTKVALPSIDDSEKGLRKTMTTWLETRKELLKAEFEAL